MTEQTPTDVIDLTTPVDANSHPISIRAIHHVRLTVTDLERSREFYTAVLGFSVEVEPPKSFDPQASAMSAILFGGIVLSRGDVRIGLRPAAAAGETFDQDRVGLDHLSLTVASLDELEQAAADFDASGISHGPIAALPPFGVYVLPFRDPDNISLELTAPMS